MTRWFSWLWLGLALLSGGARAAEVIPPAPRDHFNDYAGIVSPATARQLESELTQFERDTSNQILVAIYPHMQSESSLEDYTVRVFQAWKTGDAARKNGAILFIFSQDRRVRIATGYGLEGALPDALCKQIIENEITPRFRQGDFTGGVAAGVHGMIAATRGEYRGTGRTVAQRSPRVGSAGGLGFGLIFFLAIVAMLIRAVFRRSVVYHRGGTRSLWMGNGPWGGGGGWGGGGSSGGGGSYSGGGGSTGGGGASGSW